MDTWSLAFTDANGRAGKKTYDDETAFISGVLEKLTGLRTSNISAVLPDGTALDEQALREKFMPHGCRTAPADSTPKTITTPSATCRRTPGGSATAAWVDGASWSWAPARTSTRRLWGHADSHGPQAHGAL